MHFQDRLATANVGQRHMHLAIKASRAQQRGIQNVRAVGRGNHDNAFIALKPVHLHKQLIEGLLTLVVASPETCAALASYGVDLIDKNNTGCVLLGLLKHIPHS